MLNTLRRRNAVDFSRANGRLSRKILGLGLALIVLANSLVWGKTITDRDWLRVTMPEFALVTDQNEKQAISWAIEFGQYVAALREYFQMRERRLLPLTIVVFEFERDYLDFQPLDAHGKPQSMDGFFARHESWAVVGLAQSRMSAELRRMVFHEGTHWFMSAQNKAMPPWIAEGLAEVFSTFALNRHGVEWGQPIKSHVAFLDGILPVPLEKVLAITQGELFADRSSRTSFFYAESWLFMHYLIFGRHNMPQNGLATYRDLAAAGAPVAEAFQRAFGRPCGKMEDELYGYLRGGNYGLHRQPVAEVPPPSVERASKGDINGALARLAMAGRRWSAAQQHAQTMIDMTPSDPRGFEILGAVKLESGDGSASLGPFRRAVELGSRDFLPYFGLAHVEHRDSLRGMIGFGALEPNAARRLANLYELAINFHNRYLPAYRGLAGLVGAVEPWSVEDRRFLELGRKNFPRDQMIALGVAVLSWRGGDRDTARLELGRVLASGQDDGPVEAQIYARQLEKAWMSAPP